MATVGGNTRGVPQVYCHGEPPILILGGFSANLDGAVPAANVWGKGFTIAKGSAAGEYTLTLATPFRGTLFLDGKVHGTDNSYAVVCNSANAQTGIYTLITKYTANSANVNVPAGVQVHVQLWGSITDLNAGKTTI